MTLPERTARTFRCELWRAGFSGVVEVAAGTFLLLIAVQWFQAGAMAKAMLVAGGSIGLMAAPLVVSGVEALGWTAARAAARLVAFGAACLLAAAAVPVLPVYVAASMLGMMALASVVPLVTQVYQENYPAKLRGHFFSRAFMVRIATAALFSHGAGWLLAQELGWFRVLLLVFALAAGASAVCLWQVPSSPLVAPMGSRHPLRGLRHVREDRVFRQTLISWMFLGFANLVMLPLRIEFLANPAHGLALPADQVAFFTAVVPNIARLLLSPLWGRAFDRMNFFAMRLTVNIGFLFYIVAFFTSATWTGLLIGSIIFGISIAGGDVAWSLWVTKIAPPGRVADYMAVHTFLTGLRGIAAPVVAFYAVEHLPLGTVAWACAGLMLVANVPLLLELRRPRAAAAEEVAPVDAPLPE